VFDISKKGTLRHALTKMAVNRVPALAITDGQKIIGSISAIDIFNFAMDNDNLQNLDVELNVIYKFPQKDLLTCRPDSMLLNVLKSLNDNNQGRVWVVDSNMKLMGVVSQSDIIEGFIIMAENPRLVEV
jgi:CBS domain-containing protein